MRVDLFDFDLPTQNIALRPAEPRDAARMLVVPPDGVAKDHVVTDLPLLLKPGDAMVFNDTKVIPARLSGLRHRGSTAARIAITLHQRVAADHWLAFVRPAKRLAIGDRIDLEEQNDSRSANGFAAHVVEKRQGGEFLLAFNRVGTALDEAVYASGHVPLPPYIASKRSEDARDRSDYQTIYARHEGAVAAPTAGLHFTPELMQRLAAAGVGAYFVTLHVGAGTFLPVKASDTFDHQMHAETGIVSAEVASALNAVRSRGNRIIAVGTTSLRLLESAVGTDGRLMAWSGETAIFITPGYHFRTADILMTNFHLPRSTLFMLVSAFAGLETLQAAYQRAIASGYRFYSYGDASLLYRSDP